MTSGSLDMENRSTHTKCNIVYVKCLCQYHHSSYDGIIGIIIECLYHQARILGEFLISKMYFIFKMLRLILRCSCKIVHRIESEERRSSYEVPIIIVDRLLLFLFDYVYRNWRQSHWQTNFKWFGVFMFAGKYDSLT